MALQIAASQSPLPALLRLVAWFAMEPDRSPSPFTASRIMMTSRMPMTMNIMYDEAARTSLAPKAHSSIAQTMIMPTPIQ